MSDPAPLPELPLAASPVQPSPSPSPATVTPSDQPRPLELEHKRQQEPENLELDGPLQHQFPLQGLPSPPPFQPFFTLVTDSTTGATHHAHVHYIFSDDEPDLLTDALEQYSHTQQHQHQHQQQTASSVSGSTSAKLPTLPPPAADRAIVLDLVPKPSPPSTAATPPAYEVAWAASLSADWAVVSAKLQPMGADDQDVDPLAPTTNAATTATATATTTTAPAPAAAPAPAGNGTAAATTTTTTPLAPGADGALMLRIEGVDLVRTKTSLLDSSSGSGGGSAGQPAQQEDYSAIVDEFDKRMVVLRRVLEAGRERQSKIVVDAGAEGGPGESSPVVAGVLDHLATHAAAGHEQPEGGPAGSQKSSGDGSGGAC